MKIFVGGKDDYIKTLWFKSIAENKVSYFDEETKLTETIFDKIINKLRALYFGKKEDMKWYDNWKEYLPFSKLNRNERLIFVVFERNWLSADFNAIKSIKRFFKNAEFVLFFTNHIGTIRPEITKLIIDNIDCYDKAYTFDYGDSLKYGLKLWRGGFPYDEITLEKDENYASDIFFCGKDKERINEILKIASHLTKSGVKCRFIVISDNIENYDLECFSEIGIELRKDFIPYSEVLKYTENTKCLLEISICDNPTIRYSEAIMLKKKLLTNAKDISKMELYNDKQFFVYDDISNIPIEFILKDLSADDYIDSKLNSTDAFLNEIMEDSCNAK